MGRIDGCPGIGTCWTDRSGNWSGGWAGREAGIMMREEHGVACGLERRGRLCGAKEGSREIRLNSDLSRRTSMTE